MRRRVCGWGRSGRSSGGTWTSKRDDSPFSGPTGSEWECPKVAHSPVADEAAPREGSKSIRHLEGASSLLSRSEGDVEPTRNRHQALARVPTARGLAQESGVHILRHTFCSHLAM